MQIELAELAITSACALARARLSILQLNIEAALNREHRATVARLNAYRSIYCDTSGGPLWGCSRDAMRETQEWKRCRERARRMLGVNRYR